jgi:Fe2+ transport system protein FeoA
MRQPLVVSRSDLAEKPALETVPLCQLRPGERGRLHATDLACEDCELLSAMGMTEQCRLTVCRNGASCIVKVNATRLGLARAIAKRIMIAIEPSSIAPSSIAPTSIAPTSISPTSISPSTSAPPATA